MPVSAILAATAWQVIRGHLSAWNRAASHKVLAAGGLALAIIGLVVNAGLLMPIYRDAEATGLEVTRYIVAGAGRGHRPRKPVCCGPGRRGLPKQDDHAGFVTRGRG